MCSQHHAHHVHVDSRWMVCVLPVLFLSPRVTRAEQRQNSLQTLQGAVHGLRSVRGCTMCPGFCACSLPGWVKSGEREGVPGWVKSGNVKEGVASIMLVTLTADGRCALPDFCPSCHKRSQHKHIGSSQGVGSWLAYLTNRQSCSCM
jgi:hypothetical protein